MLLGIAHRVNTIFATTNARRKCYLAISPDPRAGKFIDNDNNLAYFIKLGDGPESRILKYTTTCPTYGFGYNDGTERAGKPLEKAILSKYEMVSQHGKNRSEWYKVIWNQQKDEQGRDLQAVLLDLMKEFETYRLDTEEGFKAASQSISKQIEAVSTVTAVDPRASFESVATTFSAKISDDKDKEAK